MPRPTCELGPRACHALVAVVALSFADPFASGGVMLLTQANFEEKLRTHPTALVAFVSPWCIVCRGLNNELVRVQTLLAQRRPDVVVAQVDASRETELAARYRAQRAPVVLFFPDTRLLAPGLQATFKGQVLHANLLAFVHASGSVQAAQTQVPRLGSYVGHLRNAAVEGTFVGFFEDGNTHSMLLDLWDLDCIKRYSRRLFVVAHGPGDADGRELWRWAGLSWSSEVGRSQEAVLFLRNSQMPVANDAVALKARFTLGDASQVDAVAPNAYKSDSWRDQVNSFCMWTERQLLDPVTVFDASRAAALDGTFDWLLLLFKSGSAKAEHRATTERWAEAPESEAAKDGSAGTKEAQALFPHERGVLQEFIEKARQDDPRYLEVLPVLVPDGDGEIQAFREHFVASGRDVGQDVSNTCPWLVVLFNTRTRHKYKGQSWGPGEEPVLRTFIDSVLSGSVLAEIRSAPPSASRRPSPSHAVEVTGLSFGEVLAEPVKSGRIEALLLVYASWCSHSVAFWSVWNELVFGLADTLAVQSPHETGFLLAQLDGTQNEHPELPYVSRFPTLRLCLRDPSFNSTDVVPLVNRSAARLRYIDYDGESSADAVRAWLREHSSSLRSLVV